ncbi:MAG: tetratricopeptide repeat protein [Candidatus Binataceae bacterium]
MRPVSDFRRVGLVAAVIGVFVLSAAIAAASGLSDFNQRLDAIEPQVARGVSDPAVASEVISQLDKDEANFAQLAESSHYDRGRLIDTYTRLEEMLNRMYTTYNNQKEACIRRIDNGGSCDYDSPERLALRALYPLSWLRFQGAMLFVDQPWRQRKLLDQAIDGFTDSTLLIVAPELVRENLLGRAYCERELGKFDHREYSKAIVDFKQIMSDGSYTRQYHPAEQGLATTYAAMGKTNQAQALTGRLANGATGAQRRGFEMLHLREMFKAEAAETDVAKRSRDHRDIIDYISARQDNKDSWAVAIAAAADYVSDPIAEFGDSNDPLENYLLANVLYYKHRHAEAARYYWRAAQSGKYPKAYRYAADLYYSQGQLETVRKIVDEVAQQRSNPDAQWATYMRFKVPRIEWERGGMRSAALNDEWIAGAQSYLKEFPHGHYAFEPRFRLGEELQHKGDYIGAAKQYQLVNGNPDYDYTARYNAAECYYEALNGAKADHKGKVAAGSAPAKANVVNAKAIAMTKADREAVRNDAILALREAIRAEPVAEHSGAASQRQRLHESRGRAIYMLANLLEDAPKVDYTEVASNLKGYEAQYPGMKEHFGQTFEWRVRALDDTAQYVQLEPEMTALAARNDNTPAFNDYVKEIGLELWQSGQHKLAAGDRNGYLADAKLTAITYGYFQRMANAGKIPVKDLTGTLSILGQSYVAMNQTDQAEAIFSQVAKADPASPDANAGLARIAQSRKDYKDAMDLWSRVESIAAESDNLFYVAKYNMAEIYAKQGNVTGACNKLAATRGQHPNLGSPAMKAQWNALQQKLCASPSHTES